MKKNNKGFSLIEVLVSVVILAIVTASILSVFVSSAKTNRKTKIVAEITDSAQNILEGMQVRTVEETILKFNGDPKLDFISSEHEDKSELSFNGTDYLEHSRIDVNGNVVITSDNDYYFGIKGMQANNRKYDAIIHLSKSNASGNSANIYEYNDLDTKKDALYVQRLIFDTEAAMFFSAQSQENDTTDFLNSMEREIYIVIDMEGENVKVEIKYKYLAKVDGSDMEYETTEYTGYFNESDFKSVYLLYIPMYSSTTAKIKDKIFIENNAKVTGDIKIVKQIIKSNGLSQSEENYRMNLYVDEALANKSGLDIYTNLGLNLDISAPVQIIPDQIKAYFNGVPNIDDSIDISTNGYLDEAAIQGQVFDVSVEIFEEGSYDKMFKDCKALTVVSGSMLN